MLGDPQESVEEAFQTAISVLEDPFKRIKALEHYGCYQLAAKNYSLAKALFDKAIEKCEKSEGQYHAGMARKGIRLLKFLNRCW